MKIEDYERLIDKSFDSVYDEIQDYIRNLSQIRNKYNKLDEEEKEEWDYSGVPIEILEKYLHQVSIRKGYQVINLMPFYGKEHDEFVFYTSSIKRTKDNIWIGNAYGITLYEAIIKTIIVINKDMKFPRNSEGSYKYE